MKVLIACGGTGGHINPGLAIAGIIAEHVPDAEFLFVGTPDGMEAELVPAAGYKMECVKAAGFQRSISPENRQFHSSCRFLFHIWFCQRECLNISNYAYQLYAYYS